MAFLIRLFRFINHESLWWPFGLVSLIAVVLWRNHGQFSLAILGGGAAFAFSLPFFARNFIIRRFAKTKIVLTAGGVALLLCMLVVPAFAQDRVGELAFGAYAAFFFGALFWSASEPMYEMMCWLAFPTEWKRFPDEIQLFDQRTIEWPNRRRPVACSLFRFRYDDKWSYGIVGPITFALFDQDFDGKPPEAIYAAYAKWYQAGVGKLIERTIDSEISRLTDSEE